MNMEELDPTILADILEANAITGERIWALITALENGMGAEAEQILDEIIGTGPDATKQFMTGMAATVMILVTVYAAMMNADPDDVRRRLAEHNAQLWLHIEALREVGGNDN